MVSRKITAFVAAGGLAAVGVLATTMSTASADTALSFTTYVVHTSNTVDTNTGGGADNPVCDEGDVATGGGFSVTNGVNVDVVDSSPYVPSTTPIGWNANIYNHDGVTRTLHVYAICAHFEDGS